MKSSGLICLPLVVLAGCATQKLTEATCIVAHESGFAELPAIGNTLRLRRTESLASLI